MYSASKERDKREPLTGSQHVPEEPQSKRGALVVGRPEVDLDGPSGERSPRGMEEELLEPGIEPCVFSKLPVVPPFVLEHHEIRHPEYRPERIAVCWAERI